jgi:hypothetical protein
MSVNWTPVTREDVVRAIQEYDQLGPERFFSAHGFAPTTTYDLAAYAAWPSGGSWVR